MSRLTGIWPCKTINSSSCPAVGPTISCWGPFLLRFTCSARHLHGQKHALSHASAMERRFMHRMQNNMENSLASTS